MSDLFIDQLSTLFMFQSESWVSSPTTIINDIQRRVPLLDRILGGMSPIKYMRGGTGVTDGTLLEKVGRFQWHGANPTFKYQKQELGQKYSVPWSTASNYLVLLEDEDELNVDDHSTDYITHQFKRLMDLYMTNMVTDTSDAMNDAMLAAPDFDLMESANPSADREPLSIHAIINETSDFDAVKASGGTFTDGGTTPGVTGITGRPPGWTGTTVQQLDPQRYPNWQNVRTKYEFGTSQDDSRKLFNALSAALTRMNFMPMSYERGAEYSTPSKTPKVIGTQLAGVINFEHALRVNQDHFRGASMSGQDPDYPGPVMRGVPVMWWEELDDVAAYPTGSNGGAFTPHLGALSTFDDTTAGDVVTANEGAENGVGFAGPRYYLMDGDNWCFAAHRSQFMKLRPPITPSQNPYARVILQKMRLALHAKSRRRHAIVAPAANITSVSF